MSDRLGAKIKENAGKPKYSSLNLNQTYKGNKVEIKTSTGATRHGLQSLGKIGSSRRIPPPANLPSLKSENSGNDPTVSLVPSGGGGWGSAKDKTDTAAPTSSSTPPPSNFPSSQPSTTVIQQPSLQPQRPIAPSSYPSQASSQQSQGQTRQENTTITKQEKSEGQAKTWGSVSQSEAGGQGKTFSHQPTPYFNREFPTLGQDNGETKPDGKENFGPVSMNRNTLEPPWMERSGPGLPPHGYTRNNDMYNGGQGSYRRTDIQNSRNNSQYAQHHASGYHPGQGGRPIPHTYIGQEQHERPSHQKSGTGSRQVPRQDRRQDQDRDKKPVVRPSVLRPEDIQAMDDEDDDGGWAGAHGEVDYTAKLNFEDFDEEDKEWNQENKVRPGKEQDKVDDYQQKPADRDLVDPVILRKPTGNNRSKQPKSAWVETQQRTQDFNDNTRQVRQLDSQRAGPEHRAAWNMQYPQSNQSQNRGVTQGHYPPLSGSTQTGRDSSPVRTPKQEGPPVQAEGEPVDEWKLKRQKQQEEMHAAVERARKRREQEELELQAKTKAAAMMKLKAIEEKTKTSEVKTEETERQSDKIKPEESIYPEKKDCVIDLEKAQHKERMEKDGEHHGLLSEPKVHNYRPDDLSRRRTDSDSSDASRSSGSKQFYHQQRNIPPRFQQQRQQQQQQYQQQQLYQAAHGTSVHSHKEFHEVAAPRPQQSIDSGPISPSGKTSRTVDTVPVKRIMKRTDSTSTAGDDVASVKSLESVGDKEKDRGSGSLWKEQETTNENMKKLKDSEVPRKDGKDTRKHDFQEDKKQYDNEKTQHRQRFDKRIDDKSASARKREYQANDKKVEEPYKRKRDENEDIESEEQQNKFGRDRQNDSRGRIRTVGLRGRGRGVGRGRQDYRVAGFDNRQRHTRDTRSSDSKEGREQRKETSDRTERPRDQKRTEDLKKDIKDKVSTDDAKEKSDSKKEDKSNKEMYDHKANQQERNQKENQEKAKEERRAEKFDKRTERPERRDDRDQRQRSKQFDSRKENRSGRDDFKREPLKEKDDTRRVANKTSRDENQKEYQRESKEDSRRGRFASRDIREEEHHANQHSHHDEDRYQDRNKRSQDGNRSKESEIYKDKPKEERTKRRDYDRYGDRDRYKREHAPRHERGGHRGQVSTRGRGVSTGRGSRRGSGRFIGSGRIVAGSYSRPTKKEELSCDDDEEDDSGSESSSYTTATSASEEKPEEIEEKPKEYPRSTSHSSLTTRPLKPGRGSRGRPGNYVRPRPQQEKPPRFQKQQERAAQQRNLGRGGIRSDRNSVRGARGRGRGRGRGRIMSSSQGNDEGKDDAVIEATENWEEDVDSVPKEHESDEKQSRKGFPPRSSSARRGSSRDDSGRFSTRKDGGQPNNQSRKGDSFLAEKQVKIEGSKSVSGEPRGSLPAAKTSDMASSKKSSGTPKDEKRTDYSAVDSIDGKLSKRTDTVKKANIELFDLHNVAGVICIDDIPDDASDISSSGFVEVTSKRTQKELKEKQREEDERRKRNEEKSNQRNADSKFKKNQNNKPPRFSKQHQGSNAQSKSFDGKLPVSVSLDGVPGSVSGSVGSNPSSTNSTKRNSPITVERSISPQGPVFNAWNKPLTLVTPAKAPGTTLVMTSNVPDPLAVGSGKPSRQPHPNTVMPIQNSLINSNIEDKSAEDELKEMTKEIESMAPTEEQEEVSTIPIKGSSKSNTETTTPSVREKRHESDKKSHPKPQRERPPRFEKTVKRKPTNNDAAKKDSVKQDDSEAVKGVPSKDKDAKEHFQTKSGVKKIDGTEHDKGRTCSDGSTSVKEITLTDDNVTEKENGDGTLPARKDSDYSVDSEGHGSGDSSMFSGRPLSVDITDSSSETQERPPTPVSPAYFEMSKRMFAARKAWEDAPSSSVGLASVSMDSPSTWSESNTSSVPRSVSTTSQDASSLGETNSEKVNDSRETSDDTVTKSEVSKSTDTQFISKKTGVNEQQNVCKVKPQQQQSVKPQHALLVTSSEERRPQDLDTISPTQPVVAQDHLPQNVSSNYPFQLEPQLLLQHRQPQHFMPQIQSLQQSSQVPANRYQIPAQIQQVPHQPTSAPSPLSQSPQELFQSQYLPNNLYSASGFPGSQSFVSIPIVATTTTPSYVGSTTRTQTLPGQQPKTASSSMFGQPGSQAQTVYMPFDPQNIGGTPALLNFNQQSQPQRPLISNHGVGFTDVLAPQPHMAQSNQHQTPQQYQRTFAFQAKPSYENDHNVPMKQADQNQPDFTHQQSEMVKHINAKPFEPPKRLSTPTSSGGTVGLMTSGVNRNVVHIRPSAPNISGLSHSPPMQTSFISNRPVSMSPGDPNVSFAAGASTYAKHAPIGHYQVTQQRQQPVQQFTPFQQQPVHIKPQQLQQPVHIQQAQTSHTQQQHNTAHITPSVAPAIPPQALLQRQFGAVGTVRPSQHTLNNQHFPGPIQRPPSSGVLQTMPQGMMQQGQVQQPRPVRQQVPRLPHNMQKPPMMSNRPPLPQQMQASNQQTQFKTLQHQKMLEETRMFFATQEQQVKMKSQQQAEVDKPKQLPQQQLHKQGQTYQQSNMKQVHSTSKQGQDSKMSSQSTRQPAQQKQVPLAPSSGVHHHNKPPRMSQDKSKQTSQDKKDKKDESKLHIIELPRKKPQDNSNKLKQAKADSSKSEDANQTSKFDGKVPVNKRGGPIRIAPIMQKTPQGSGRGNRQNRTRPPMKNTSTSVPSNKPKSDVTTRVATGSSGSATAPVTKPLSETAGTSKGNSQLGGSSSTDSKEVKASDPLPATS